MTIPAATNDPAGAGRKSVALTNGPRQAAPISTLTSVAIAETKRYRVVGTELCYFLLRDGAAFLTDLQFCL